MKIQADNYNGVIEVKDLDQDVEICHVENFYHQLSNNPDDTILATEIELPLECEYYVRIKEDFGIKILTERKIK